MRSSKKRSRSSQNRPRSLGNIVNRVFDSSGPEGKVRGTPQQIIEKYQMLARDAQLSNDRVAAENFLQHAEHYTRMLAEAMREMAAEQEARQQQYQPNFGQNVGQSVGQGQNGGQQRGDQQRGDQTRGDQTRGDQTRGDQTRGEARERGDRPDRGDRRPDLARDSRPDREPVRVEIARVADVIDLDTGDETGLIDTPETQSQLRDDPDAAPVAVGEDALPGGPVPSRRPRGPRKPRAEGKPGGSSPKEAAE